MLGWILFLIYLAVSALPLVMRRFSLRGRLIWAVIVAVVFVGLRVAIQLATESLWYADLGYEQRYWNIIIPEIAIFAISFFVAFVFVMANFLYIFRATSAARFIKIAALLGCFLFSTAFAVGMTSSVYEYLRFSNQVPFNLAEPVFNMDIGFYIFTLPFLKTVRSAIFVIVLASMIGSVVLYGGFASKERLKAILMRNQGVINIGTTDHHRIVTHMSVLGIVLIGVFMFWTQIAKWDLMYSPRGAVFGPG
ncbi:MAG TPA: UPF0182 family protein, partial [Dissulfurispiraceae bacterium]|nr:UPF0182 family protein [Dissulfurispiraceae bacterium]